MALSRPNTSTMAMSLLLALILHSIPSMSQILPSPTPPSPTSPCTSSMLTSFTPCMGFLTNNTTNATTPTPGCCSSLKSLTSNGTGCLCQFFTGAVPFQIPINRTLAISLPKACNMGGVPLQCNVASGAPAPAPASAAMTPTQPPTTAASPSTTGPAEVPASSPAATSPSASDSNPTQPIAPTGTPPGTSSTTSRGTADTDPSSSSTIRSLQILSHSSLLLVLVALINY